jgi:hypothetical protein
MPKADAGERSESSPPIRRAIVLQQQLPAPSNTCESSASQAANSTRAGANCAPDHAGTVPTVRIPTGR